MWLKEFVLSVGLSYVVSISKPAVGDLGINPPRDNPGWLSIWKMETYLKIVDYDIIMTAKKLMHDHFMATISPRDPYTPTAINLLVRYFVDNFDKTLFVKEMGKRGDHQHFHIVCQNSTSTRSDVYRKKILKCEHLHGDAKELKITLLRDHPDVFYVKYLQKEPNSEVVFNNLIDLKNLPQPPEFIYNTLVGKRVITPLEAPTLLIAYCDENELPLPVELDDLHRLLIRLVGEGYIVSNVVRQKREVITIIRLYDLNRRGIDYPMKWTREFCDDK